MSDLRPYLRAVVGSSKLTIGDRLVLHVLATYANEDGAAWPSSRTMSNACGMHPDAVRRALGHLLGAGVIAADRRPGRATVYRFPVHPSTTCGPWATTSSARPVTDGPRTCDPSVRDLWPTGHAEEPRSNKEEESDAVHNYGDHLAAARMRAAIEAARDEARRAVTS